MAISGDYQSPVMVNGYSCKNCTDVDYAKKHIDPAHPKDGPYGATKTEGAKDSRDTRKATDAVSFGGALSPPAGSRDPSAQPPSATGSRLNISV
jgi:hypothetical protein